MSTPLHQSHAASYRSKQVAPPSLVTDGVWAVPVPLRGSPLRSIIVYLVESSEGPVLIDAGYRHPDCWDSFRDSLRQLGLRPESIPAVLLTHNHPDHVGFADQVRQVSGAQVVMHEHDDFARQRALRGGFVDQLRRALAMSGAPADVAATMYDEALTVAHHAEDLVLDRALGGDTTLSFGDLTVRAVHAPGHTYGHTVYLARGAVFTGDTMMPEGPTQLALPSLPGDDPARELLRTLARIRDLSRAEGIDVACPAHQFAFRDVAERAAALHAFHAGEVARVRELLERAGTAWEIAPHLTWARPWDELGTGTRRFALMHSLALLRGAQDSGGAGSDG